MLRQVALKRAPPIAVLTDRGTGSSGEAIAVAFTGGPDTRFFGDTTLGAATATFAVKLSDGAQIYLVVSTMLNRHDNEYPTGITPNEEILSDATLSWNESVLRAASEWLSKRRACQLAATK